MGKDKKPNVMTAGEVFNVGLRNPTIIGIALRKATYTHGLIMQSKQFTVNLPTVDILDKVDLVGTISGRDGLDKFTEYGLTSLPSAMIDVPIIKECPINLECKLLNVSEVGDHDLFLGEVMAMHADSGILNEKQEICIEKANGFLLAEKAYYTFGAKLNDLGYTRR